MLPAEGGAVEAVLMDGLVMVRLTLDGVIATSSDGRDVGVLPDESEPAFERGMADKGRGLSSRENMERSSPFH